MIILLYRGGAEVSLFGQNRSEPGWSCHETSVSKTYWVCVLSLVSRWSGLCWVCCFKLTLRIVIVINTRISGLTSNPQTCNCNEALKIKPSNSKSVKIKRVCVHCRTETNLAVLPAVSPRASEVVWAGEEATVLRPGPGGLTRWPFLPGDRWGALTCMGRLHSI